VNLGDVAVGYIDIVLTIAIERQGSRQPSVRNPDSHHQQGQTWHQPGPIYIGSGGVESASFHLFCRPAGVEK
jgi:hypothetical protein